MNSLTSPAKKQQCFLSMCLPKDIWSRVSRMWRVSKMSDSRANGCLRLALSRRGIWPLIHWNLWSIWFWSRWKAVFRMVDPICSNLLHVCGSITLNQEQTTKSTFINTIASLCAFSIKQIRSNNQVFKCFDRLQETQTMSGKSANQLYRKALHYILQYQNQ